MERTFRLIIFGSCILVNLFVLRSLISLSTIGIDPMAPRHPQFVYLIQGHSVHDIPGLRPTINRDFIWLTYRDRSGDIYYPNSTFTQGRNRLLREAVARSSKRDDDGYLYYIFMDDDVHIVSEKNKTLWYRNDLPANPYDRFEMFLLDYLPAIGVPRGPVDMLYRPVINDTVSLRYNFDACFNGFHRHALSFMLPYVEDLDHISWWFHQWYVIHLSAMLYNSYRIQINAIHYVNGRNHGDSDVKGDYRDSSDFNIARDYTKTWMARKPTVNSIYSGRISLLRTFTKPAMYQYLRGNARRKGKMEYRVSTKFIMKTFNTSHPVIERILSWRAQPDVHKVLYGNGTVEPKFIADTFPMERRRVKYGI